MFEGNRRKSFEYDLVPNTPQESQPNIPNDSQAEAKVTNISRRNFITIIGGAIVVAGAGIAGAYYLGAFGKPSSTSTLNGLGPSFMIDSFTNYDSILQSNTGIKLTHNVTDLDSIRSIMLSGSGSSQYDFVDYDSSGWLALKAASPPVTKTYPVSAVSKWTNIYELWTNPEGVIGTAVPPPLGPQGPYIANSVIYPHMWAASPGASSPEDDFGQKGSQFFIAPIDWNYDAVLYNPKYVNISHDTTTGISKASWYEMYNPDYKGKSTILDVPTTATNHVALYLVENNLMSPPARGCNDLNLTEMTTVVNFLIDQKKAGQFRVAWSDFGTLVSDYVNEDVWIGDAWQPVEYYVRDGGGPCYYIEPTEGYRNWLDGTAPTAGTSKENLVYTYIDWELGGLYAKEKAVFLGYHTPNYLSSDIQSGMGPELWDWVYNGKATYQAEDPAKDALFDPIKYNWSSTAGTPSSSGNLKDCGSIQRRTAHVGVWGRYPHDATDYFTQWNRFRSA
jgi:putative spermidine/putrescine transport system substrate-binding protein